MSSSPSNRILSLESIRGLAAFAVVISHLVMAFADPYDSGRPARIETLPSAWQTILEAVYRPIRDGQFAVMVFFVLSGVVLSEGFRQRGRMTDLLDSIVRRYPRLAIPAIASACLSCALWQLGFMLNQPTASRLIDSGFPAGWLSHYDQPSPSFFDAIRQAGFEIFFAKDDPHPSTMYNAVLWTMRSELFGSLLIFGLLGLCGTSKRLTPISIVATLALAFVGQTRLALFPAGMALASIRRQNPRLQFPLVLSIILLAIAYGFCGAYTLGDFKPRQLWAGGFGYLIVELVCGLAAILTIAAVMLTPCFSRALEVKPLVWLGRVSFGLYLVHLPIILSLGCFVFGHVAPQWGHGLAMLVASIVVISVVLPAAWLMFQLVDRPAMIISRTLGRWLVRRPVS